jgi:hypothetical protein
MVPSTSMIPANSAPWSKNARNFAFASAASASSWRSRSSACRCRVTSRTILEALTTLPASSLMGEIVRETRMRRLSDRVARSRNGRSSPGLQAGDDVVFLGYAVGG